MWSYVLGIHRESYIMTPTPSAAYSQRLFTLLDGDHFTTSRSLRKWLTPENEVLLHQLCAIVNLVSAQQGLSKAVLLVKHKPSNIPSLKDYRNVQENAKGVLDTVKFVYASLEKGLMIARARKDVFHDDISSLELSQSHLSYCLEFWKSDKIYDPVEVSSFVGKIIELYDNNDTELFGSYQSILNSEEGKALQALIDGWKRLSRKVNSHKDDSDSVSIRSNRSHGSHKTSWSLLKSHVNIFDNIHVPHVQLDGLLHHLPHMPKPTIQLHLPHVLVDHTHGPDVGKAIHGFLGLSARDSRGQDNEVDANPGTLAKATQMTLQKVLKWCSHRCQSPSSIDISIKISEETVNYAYAINQSIRASILILLNAHDALSIRHNAKDLTPEDIQILHNLSISALQEQKNASLLFNTVDEDVYELLKYAKIAHEQEKHLVDDRSHEFEDNNDALELLKHEVERYMRWWTQASMDLDYEVDACAAAKLSDSALRRQGILDKWKEIRAYFMQYPEKIDALKETFHDLFDKALDFGPRLQERCARK